MTILTHFSLDEREEIWWKKLLQIREQMQEKLVDFSPRIFKPKQG